MVSGATLGAIAGFGAALITLAIPLAGFLYRLDRHVQKALQLLTGHEELEGDGVLPRLAEVEQRSVEHRIALREAEEVEVPDLDEDQRARRAD